MKKIFDLPVCGYDRAKSFYGKAKIIETENGEKVSPSLCDCSMCPCADLCKWLCDNVSKI